MRVMVFTESQCGNDTGCSATGGLSSLMSTSSPQNWWAWGHFSFLFETMEIEEKIFIAALSSESGNQTPWPNIFAPERFESYRHLSESAWTLCEICKVFEAVKRVRCETMVRNIGAKFFHILESRTSTSIQRKFFPSSPLSSNDISNRICRIFPSSCLKTKVFHI